MTIRRRRLTGGTAFGPLEDLRQGTLEQWESEWFWLEPDSGAAGGEAIAQTRRHDLGEIPANVFIERDDTGDGRNARDATSDVTVTKDRETITVTNTNTSEGFYVRIRAR